MFNKKLVEGVLAQQITVPASRTATATLFNGQTATNGYAVDRLGFEEVVFIVSAGTVAASATLDAQVYEGDTDNTTLATAVASASVTQITASNDDALHIVSVDARPLKRYLWLRMQYNATGAASLFGAVAIKGAPVVLPTAATGVDADI